jgi:hypothetical protein
MMFTPFSSHTQASRACRPESRPRSPYTLIRDIARPSHHRRHRRGMTRPWAYRTRKGRKLLQMRTICQIFRLCRRRRSIHPGHPLRTRQLVNHLNTACTGKAKGVAEEVLGTHHRLEASLSLANPVSSLTFGNALYSTTLEHDCNVVCRH